MSGNRSGTRKPPSQGINDDDADDEASDLEQERPHSAVPPKTSTASIQIKIEPTVQTEKTKVAPSKKPKEKQSTKATVDYYSGDEADSESDLYKDAVKDDKDPDKDTATISEPEIEEENTPPSPEFIDKLAHRLGNAFKLDNFNEAAIKYYLFKNIEMMKSPARVTVGLHANIYKNDLVVMGILVERFLHNNAGKITTPEKAKQLMMVCLEYFLNERYATEPFASAAGLEVKVFLRIRNEFFIRHDELIFISSRDKSVREKEYRMDLRFELHVKPEQFYAYKQLVLSRSKEPIEQPAVIPFSQTDNIKPNPRLKALEPNTFNRHAKQTADDTLSVISSFTLAREGTKHTVNLPYAFAIYDAVNELQNAISKNQQEQIIIKYQKLLEVICNAKEEARGWFGGYFSGLRKTTTNLGTEIAKDLQAILPKTPDNAAIFKKAPLDALRQITEEAQLEEKKEHRP